MSKRNNALISIARRAASRALAINWFGWMPGRVKLRLVNAAGLCDWDWYGHFISRQPGSSPQEGMRHFLSHGNGNGDSPSPLFDPVFYAQRFGLKASPLDALFQYMVIGDWLGLRPCPLFDPRYCRNTAPRGQRSLRPVAGRYLRDYTQAGQPHPLFDQEWYLDRYADVRRSGSNPLVHFLYNGIPEGRLPNPYFSPSWYLEAYPDVANAAMHPSSHFIAHGAAEARSPGPDFNARQYLDAYPDVATSGMTALAHYLAIGRKDGRQLGKRPLAMSDFATPTMPRTAAAPTSAGVIDIILPVYRGLEETRNCIESVLVSHNVGSTRLHIYNDRSPEPEVTAYLRELAQRDPAIRLVENVENLGFVRTVNAGMRHALGLPDSDGVLLLNSDTIVSFNWVDRLAAHARQAHVGSVTALSNNATICSYPTLGANALPAGMTSAELDELAWRTNPGQSVEVPTGVGFCMLITRHCLETAGVFDEEAFGKGYGEENDFCMRAATFGFRHLLAMDVFVEHVGEVSFADDSKPGKIIAQKIIDERYPDYGQRVSRFCTMDPGFAARIRLSLAVWAARKKPVTALLTHTWGGGTERAVQEMVLALADQSEVLIVRPVEELGEGGTLRISHPSSFDPFEFIYRYRTPQELAELLALLGVQAMQLHHLVGFGNSIRRAIGLAGIPYTFYVHDNYTVCPQITLTNRQGNYCGEPDALGCDACIAERPSHGAADIRNWRSGNEWAALGAYQVVAPSVDAASRMERYTGVPVSVRYHEPELTTAVVEPARGAGAKPYKVVLLGVLAAHKGLVSLTDLATTVRANQQPVEFHLIGYPQGESEERLPFSFSGPYVETELDSLIEAYAPDAFLFLSQAPETYSYTLSHAIRTGLPIAANRLGAFTERLAEYPDALLLSSTAPAQQNADELVGWLESLYQEAQA